MKFKDIRWHNLSRLEKIVWSVCDPHPHKLGNDEPCSLYPVTNIFSTEILRDGRILHHTLLNYERQRTNATAILIPEDILGEFEPLTPVAFQLYAPLPTPTPEDIQELLKKYPKTTKTLYEERKRIYRKTNHTPTDSELKAEITYFLQALDTILKTKY